MCGPHKKFASSASTLYLYLCSAISNEECCARADHARTIHTCMVLSLERRDRIHNSLSRVTHWVLTKFNKMHIGGGTQAPSLLKFYRAKC